MKKRKNVKMVVGCMAVFNAHLLQKIAHIRKKCFAIDINKPWGVVKMETDEERRLKGIKKFNDLINANARCDEEKEELHGYLHYFEEKSRREKKQTS